MSEIAARWERFWFAPEPTSTLALVRIAAGLVAFAWGLSLWPDLFDLYAADGVLPSQPGGGAGSWGPLGILGGDTALVCFYAALLLGSMALALGLFTRLAALVVFLALLAFARRNPFVLNDGDALLRLLVLYLTLAPAGASLSLDRLRRAPESFWQFPARAPWALRLIQLQLCAVYLSTLVQRLRGDYWTDGTAVAYVLRLEELQRLPVSAVARDSLALAHVATFGTLAIELALALLVWNHRMRPWVLGLGVGLHLSIEYSLRVGFFSFAVLACYLAFVQPHTARAWILAVRDRVRAAPAARARRAGLPDAGVCAVPPTAPPSIR